MLLSSLEAADGKEMPSFLGASEYCLQSEKKSLFSPSRRKTLFALSCRIFSGYEVCERKYESNFRIIYKVLYGIILVHTNKM